MSLINRETGIAANSSIADTKDKIIADQQASLYDTAKEIEKLKAVISEKDRAIKAVRIEKSEVERELAESRAALSESEKETEEYKQKYEYAKDQPVKYEYSDKCNHCRKSEYDKKMAETELNLVKLKNDTQKYEELVRDQEKLIQEKADEIVKKWTCPQRCVEWVRAMIEIGDNIAFLYVLIYGFVVTVITAFKSEVLRTDFINMLRFDWKVISETFTGTKEIITLIADSVNDMENTGLAKVLHVVIIVLLTIIAVGIAGVVIYGIVRFVIYFIQECVEEYMGMSFWAMTLTDLAGCVFIGKDICSVDDHHWNIWAVFTGLIILYLFAEAIAFSDKQNWRH